MQTTEKERIIAFIDAIGVSIRAFEMDCGLSNGIINNLKGSFSKSTLDKISAKYPELNINWLVVGEGSMLKPNEPTIIYNKGTANNAVSGSGIISVSNQEQSKEVEYLKSIIKEKDEQIKLLKKMLNIKN